MKSEHGTNESVLFSGVRVNGDYAPVIQDYYDCKDLGFKSVFYDETDCNFEYADTDYTGQVISYPVKTDFPEGMDRHK